MTVATDLERRPVEVPQEPLQHVAYTFDGTLEGLLSAVFAAYERREVPEDIVSQARYQPRLGQSAIFIPTDYGRALRVRRGVERCAGAIAFTAVLRASTCEDYDMGASVYRFVRLVMARTPGQRQHSVLDDLASPVVARIVQLARHAGNEAERLRQFVRFQHLANGVWFARVKPNAAVVPLVMGYFASRLNDQAFIIFDEAHGMAGVYDGRSCQLVASEAVNPAQWADDEALMQDAWRCFYDALSIDERYNPELRRHFMPVRLWSNLTEMQ